ncbi:MAG: Ig-like domain-containing protein [bacterium]
MHKSFAKYRRNFFLSALISLAIASMLMGTLSARHSVQATHVAGVPTPLAAVNGDQSGTSPFVAETLAAGERSAEKTGKALVEQAERSGSSGNVVAANRLSFNRTIEYPRDEESEREPERKQDQPDKAEEWRRLAMIDEKGKILEGALLRAWNQAKAMTVDSQAWPVESGSAKSIDPAAGINTSGWTWLGPGNIGGRIRSIIVHPTDPQTLWVGSVGGGVWKTTNGGASWSPMSDFLASIAIGSMAIDPTNPNVLYVGTGEGFGNQDRIQGAGIFKTTDGGITWAQLPATANPSWFFVNRLAVNPTNSQIILAATLTGIWRTPDGGASWSQRSSSAALDLNIDPNDANKAIASGTSGARYSVDGGLTWTAATGVPSGGRSEVAYARSDSSIVYASVEAGTGQLYRSTDGGFSYSLVNSGTYLQSQGWYDNIVWVDPTNPNTVIVGGISLWRSTNGGTTLNIVGALHTDQHAIVESPVDGTVYFGNDGGIWRTTNFRAPTMVVQSLNNNLGITQFYGGAGNAASGRVIGGTQDNGTLRYSGGTGTWNSMAGGDGGWCASDLTDPNYFYGEFQYLQLHRSTNGGLSSSDIYQGISDAGGTTGSTNFIAPFVIDPNDPNTLLAGGSRLWRSTNAKTTVPSQINWTIIKNTVGPNISAIAVAKGNSNIIWVGHNNGSIYYTTNGTDPTPTWTQANSGSPLPGTICTRIAIDPTNSSRVYATFGQFTSSGKVWRTNNNGVSWTNLTSNLPLAPVRTITVWEQDPNFLYVGTEVGVFASANGGLSWSPTNDGPTNCSVNELFWMGNTLVAATHGRGMFSIGISTGQLPTVNITSPASGASFDPPANITINATAGDSDGFISKVDFFADNTIIGTAIAMPYSVTWTNASGGPHVLTARATDNSGNTTVSAPINISVTGPVGPSNNYFATAQVLSGYSGSVSGSNVGADKEPGEPNHEPAGNIGGASVWYRWLAPASGPVTITTEGSSFDTLLGVYTGTSVSGLTIIARNDDEGTPGILTSRVSFNAVGGTTYQIAVDGYNQNGTAGTGNVVLNLSHTSNAPSLQLTFGRYSVVESGGSATLTVFRSGPTTVAATVDYRTSDTAALNNCSVINGVASARCDYAISVGTLRFAVGEATKTISIPIVDDSYSEGNESFTITLSNVTGDGFGTPTSATVTITDNDGAANGPNPIDQTPFFVRQHYIDFLNREPDPAGYAGWQDILNKCHPGDISCDRIHVSSAFFLAPEFQQRGYFIYRFYPVAFGRKPDYAEFMPDIARVSGFLTPAELEAAKVAFSNEFIARPAFVSRFNGLSASQYVDLLLSTAGVTVSQTARNNWIALAGAPGPPRAQVLREINESAEVSNKYFNQAFVVMQYFGYLRRDPDAFYLDWIQLLDTTGDSRSMVNGFMNSPEYRLRFGP